MKSRRLDFLEAAWQVAAGETFRLELAFLRQCAALRMALSYSTYGLPQNPIVLSEAISPPRVDLLLSFGAISPSETPTERLL